jgi:hypothetical protein
MALDPNIALSIKPVQLANPLEQYMQVQQIQQAQNQSRLADLMYGEKEREVADTARLNDQYKNAIGADGVIDRSKLLSGIASAGLGSRLPVIQKSFADADKAQADVSKTKAETGKIDHETAAHQFELAGQLASAWAQNPNITQQQIRSGLAAAANSKIISPEIYQAKLAELDNVSSDPKSLNQWALGTLQQVQKAKDSMSYIAPDANTVATNATSRANNASTNATTRRGQDLTDARARDLNILTREGQQTQVVVDPNQGPLLINKATKTAVPASFADGTRVPSENSVAARKLNDQLKAGIDAARELIPKATASGAGALADKTAAFFGKSTEGADAAAQLDTLAGWMTSNVPRMQGPQSDKDVLLYRQMAGDVSNRSLPASRRLAALDTLEKLQSKYADINQAGGTQAPTKAGGGVPNTNAKGWTLHTDANGNRAYVSPDGKSYEEVK